jgi:uncharacterized membrane protein
MPRFTPARSDERFDTVLAYVLRAGVLLSATVVACGGLVFLARHGFERPAYHGFRGEPLPLRSVHGIVAEGLRLSGRGLIQVGLLLLIATPIARVVFSVAGFVRQRDWLYVAITLVVLALLGSSLLAGA